MFDDLLAKLGPQDAVAHIGPGVLYERMRYYAGCRARVLIAEPDPVRAAALRRFAPKTSRIEIVEKAVREEAGSLTLRRYNFDALTSLRDLSGLRGLFPGLRETETITVDAMPASRLIEKLPADHRGRDLLVADSLGDAFANLIALDEQGALERFSAIAVRTSRAPAFDGASDAEDLLAWLDNRRYDRPVAIDGADPDLPIFFVQRNPLSEDLARQESVAQALRAHGEEREAALANAEAKAEERQAALVEAEAKAEKSDRDLRVAMRLQSAAQDDLRDLQRQYAALRDDKERQDALLRKVTQKLAYASDYLRRIAVDAPEAVEMMEDAAREMDKNAPEDEEDAAGDASRSAEHKDRG